MFLGALRIDIRAYRCERRAAHAANEISPMPEQGFPIELCQMVRKSRPSSASAGGLEVVYQYRDIKCRVDVHQKMHMILLPSKLDEVAAPRRQAIPKRLSQILQQIWRECFAPIFGHKHAMQLKVKYCR